MKTTPLTLIAASMFASASFTAVYHYFVLNLPFEQWGGMALFHLFGAMTLVSLDNALPEPKRSEPN